MILCTKRVIYYQTRVVRSMLGREGRALSRGDVYQDVNVTIFELHDVALLRTQALSFPHHRPCNEVKCRWLSAGR
ncbi:hypothetical protein M378DRAFT_163436 [Amanita muscaria Koide BX008]|uniref:Uncharacterized protein n=1 Tax=Amanita muscaria (strain Koide BX008) TaxID=946122 RepID=A0A0C2SLX2_AMAMK|nr:hypothetical protein M378DRAFT_163436 [Amanita muscaria Koide BX008]